MRSIPAEATDLQVCIERTDGITVFDVCPSREIFAGFISGPDFRVAVERPGCRRRGSRRSATCAPRRLRTGIDV